MSAEREQSGTGPAGRSGGCRFAGDEIILHVYEEDSPAELARMQDHLTACIPCREEVSSLRATLDLIGQAEIGIGTATEPDGEWPRLRERIAASGPVRAISPTARVLLKAAGITVLVGASFVSGRLWQSPSGPGTPGQSPASEGNNRDWTTAQDSLPALSAEAKSALLQKFSRETHGYLKRSRMVLLAFSNAAPEDASSGLTQASAALLREASRARRLAGECRDPRLQELMVQLEQVLNEIARVSTGDDSASAARVRASADLASVLDQLEILAGQTGRKERSNA